MITGLALIAIGFALNLAGSFRFNFTVVMTGWVLIIAGAAHFLLSLVGL